MNITWRTGWYTAFFVMMKLSTSSFMRDDGFAIFKRKKNKWCKNDQPNLWGRPTFWLDCMVFTGRPAPKINFKTRDIGPQLSHQVTSICVQPVLGDASIFIKRGPKQKNLAWWNHRHQNQNDQTIDSTIINLFILTSSTWYICFTFFR